MLPIPHKTLDFKLPDQLTRAQPTEERGLQRDDVRLLVSKLSTDHLFHTQFHQIDRFLRPGDVLIINTSATLPAALDTILPTGQQGRLHLSSHFNNDLWIGELRQLSDGKPKRYFLGQTGDEIRLPGGGRAILLRPYYGSTTDMKHLHLWEIRLELAEAWPGYLQRFGKAIRYDEREYPMSYYQTAFATEAGSAEMPSAGRAFTHPLITRLLVKGIQFAPILLHTGVSSLEADEQPYPEYFKVPAFTAAIVNLARKKGQRIIAVGTTAVRAIESAVAEDGFVEAAEGWTDLHITSGRGLQVVNGLLTGFHEPRASHLQMLEALAGLSHLEIAYRAAVEEGYFWHEFGDLHLMV